MSAFNDGTGTKNITLSPDSLVAPPFVQDASSLTIISGWWNISTLTSARYLFGSGGTFLRVHTTTTELFASADYNTTDHQFTTSGANLVTNEWFFAALLFGRTVGSTNIFNVWVGRNNILTESTLTLVGGPSGSVVQRSDLTLLNSTVTATNNLHGYVSEVWNVNLWWDGFVANNPIKLFAYDNFVQPMFQGTFDPFKASRISGEAVESLGSTGINNNFVYAPLSSSSINVEQANRNAFPYYTISYELQFPVSNTSYANTLTSFTPLAYSSLEPPVRQITIPTSPKINPLRIGL